MTDRIIPPERYVEITNEPWLKRIRYDVVSRRRVTFYTSQDGEVDVEELIISVQRIWRLAVELSEKEVLTLRREIGRR